MTRPQDAELISIYRDQPSEHVNPVHIRGVRRVYDKGVEDGYEQARKEYERRLERYEPQRWEVD